MIEVKINGEKWEVPPETQVANLLCRFKLSPKVCAVEINSEIVPRSEYRKRAVKNGDQVEIIRLMAGG